MTDRRLAVAEKVVSERRRYEYDRHNRDRQRSSMEVEARWEHILDMAGVALGMSRQNIVSVIEATPRPHPNTFSREAAWDAERARRLVAVSDLCCVVCGQRVWSSTNVTDGVCGSCH